MEDNNENNLNESSSTDKTFVEFSELDSEIETLKKPEYNNPFSEEFNPADVVNRGDTSNFIVDDLLKIKQLEMEEEERNKTKQFYLSKKEFDYLISENPRINVYKKDEAENLVNIDGENGEFKNNFSKELVGIPDDELIEISIHVGNREIQEPTQEGDEPIIDDGYYRHHSDYDDDNYYISDEEAEELHKQEKLQATLKAIEDAVSELSKDEKYVNPDDLFREFLQDNFRDYLLAKKITGQSDTKYSDKILPKEKINNINEKIEVTDLHNKHTVGDQKTSVIINRNEYAEIDSIEVYCKCGEKTIIRFQEQDMPTTEIEARSVEIKSNTDVVVDTIEVEPIYSKEYENKFTKNENEIAEEEIEKIVEQTNEEE